MKYIFFLSLFMGIFFIASAQKTFSEGSIQYDVFLDGHTVSDGTYIISVKGAMLKRELIMKNGYNNVTIYNQKTGKTLSMNIQDDQKFAVEISEAELKEKNKRFENAILTPNEHVRKIAGYHCEGMDIQYTNIPGNEIFYTKDLLPPNEAFNSMFPGLKGVALKYETKFSGNSVMTFVATLVEIKMIESSFFTIPSSYKIITKEELQRMN